VTRTGHAQASSTVLADFSLICPCPAFRGFINSKKFDSAFDSMRSEAMILAGHESMRSIAPLDVLESGRVHTLTIHLH